VAVASAGPYANLHSPQTDNHASIPPLSFFYRSDDLPATQPTASKHTHNHFMALWILFGMTLGEPVPEETFTHSYLWWSSIIPYLLPPSVTIHGIPSVQSFPQYLSKFSLVYLLAWHPPLHTPYISSTNHCLLFAAHAILSQPVFL